MSKIVKLNDIEKGTTVFEPCDLKQCSKVVQDHFQRMYPDQKPLKFETGRVNHSLVDVKNEFQNSFVTAALTAYNHHLPLELSPDDIWVLVALGVAQHLGGDKDLAETYRKVFVDHQGKKELSVDATNLGIHAKSSTNTDGWPLVIEKWCQMIKENTKTDLSGIITAPFSTTGPVELVVYHCTLMDTMKNYFDYSCYCMCCIPEVVLHGDANDWESVLNRTESLKTIFPDFTWHLDRVSGHISKILATVRGEKPDLKWWNTMIFKVQRGSGGQTELTGWLADFTPYIFRRNGEREKNTRKKHFSYYLL